MPECFIPLNGVVNFRDMGGLNTLDGKRVKKGLLFRAGDLSGLTEEDLNFLQKYNIRRVFDYRRDSEVIERPDPRIGSAINERIPVIKDNNITSNVMTKKPSAYMSYFNQFTVERFIKIYAEMPIQNASYKRLMTLIKNPEKNLPLIHHCSGGRDRTGVGSLLILLTLGVPYEVVLEDFLLSNQALAEYYQKLFLKASKFISEEEYDRLIHAFPLREEYLQCTINCIIQTYGNFETYILEEFGLTEEIRLNIKNYCLE